MTPDLPTTYDQLTPEEAAQIDAVCDRFEQAWKKTKAGSPAPCLASFMEHPEGSARAVLLQELVALDRTCRQRYGVADDPGELGPAAEDSELLATHDLRQDTDVLAGLPGWPSIPGLELVGVLGSGGMGVVFKARQATLDRDVAVKVLHGAHQTDPEQRARFLREARAVARLRHPHLVQVYEFGEAPAPGGVTSQPYLVLEYVPGSSLVDLVRHSPQPPREAARLVETLADAIHYAHQQGVIHRDLKPANVLLQGAEVQEKAQVEGVRDPRPLTADVCAKITDFGLAKLLTDSDLTRSGHVLGTPSYMAPEQIGKSGPITAAVDVYGLGAILYETLTGRPPFAAATGEATLVQVQLDDPVPPRRLQPTVPRDLETICLKCLRKEAGRRYATAQELADDLRRFGAGEPIRARPVGMGERVVIWCRRNPVVAGLLAALVLVFLVGSAGVLWQWQRARQERDIARLEKERAERHLQLIYHRVDKLKKLGTDLLRQPGKYGTGQDVLHQALAFYRDLLPEEGDSPVVRREAARLFRQVAEIHHHLGEPGLAAEAYGHQESQLSRLLEKEPANKALRWALADTYRWKGNALRDEGKTREARLAYDQSVKLHKELLEESPDNAHYQMALANTFLNMTTVLSRRDQAEKIESLYQQALDLCESAVRAAPKEPGFQTELALGLETQGLFFLSMGQASKAETAIRKSLQLHQRLLDEGQMKGRIERFLARSFVRLGQVLAVTGKAPDVEKSYRQAVKLLDRPVEELSESELRRADLAQTLASLADLLKDPDRRSEAEELRRRVIHSYETLRADFRENAQYKRRLARSYLALVRLLWERGRPSDATEPYRKALELDPEDPGVNNELAWFLVTTPEPRLRDAALAVRLGTKAVTAQRQSGDYWNTLGMAHYRNGDDKAAIANLKTAMSLREGGDSFDWFVLAMAHWRLGERDKARTWLNQAVEWMDRHRPHDDELRRFRAEAETLVTDMEKR
jgi:tetratricopeptide (TPR) repeat protein